MRDHLRTEKRIVAVFSDIHSNYHAFKACYDDAIKCGADSFVFLGDYVSDLSEPQKTMDLVYEVQSRYPTICLRGNREGYMLDCEKGASRFSRGSKSGSLLFTYNHLRKNIRNTTIVAVKIAPVIVHGCMGDFNLDAAKLYRVGDFQASEKIQVILSQMLVGKQQRTGFRSLSETADAVQAFQHISFPVTSQANGRVFLPDFINKIHCPLGFGQVGNIIPQKNERFGIVGQSIPVTGLKSMIIGMNIGKYGNFHKIL